MLNRDLDTKNMYADLENYTSQIEETLKDLQNLTLPKYSGLFSKKIDKIVFCGMGGSAIGGDLIRACFENEMNVPMSIKRNYSLPNFVNKKSLVIVCSFSGNTEETLSCFEDAKARGAQIVTISSGGELEKLSQENNIPFFKINYQSQCGQPRVNSGVMLTAVAQILAKLGLIELDENIWAQIIENLEDVKMSCQSENNDENIALEIAENLYEKIPVFHGAGFAKVIARRMMQDINETAKQFSFCEPIPEASHNAVVGYEFPENKNFVMVSLESSLDNTRNAKRWEILKQIWDKRELDQLAIESNYETKLEQTFYFVYLGMWIAYYLGILNGIDPTPVEIIKFLKNELAKS